MSEILGSVRASSWGDLFDCAARWAYKQEGWRLPSRGASVVGSAVHRGTAIYDKAVLENSNQPLSLVIGNATDAAAAWAKAPQDEEGNVLEVQWKSDEGEDERIGPGEAVDYSVKLVAKYCREVAPNMTYSAVEVKCKGLDVTTEHGIVRLTGTTDRVRKFAGRSGISDFKSGGKAVEGIKVGKPVAVTRGHQMQTGAYTLMTEAETKQELNGPATILGFQTTSKLWIAEGTIERPKLALTGNSTKPGMIELAAMMLKSGVFPPNPKSVLCSKKWCPAHPGAGGPCPYGA